MLPEDVVFVLTSMMTSVVRSGTGFKARKLGRPIAGKTGTSGDFRDAWFAGFTRQHVAVTWVGFDAPRRMSGETGGKTAIPIWLAAMQAASSGESQPFVPPTSVSVRTIDKASGLLVPTGSAAADYQGKTLEEYFLQGTEPTQEAVPAELPKGDVLLGLYDDDPPTDNFDPAATEPADDPADPPASDPPPSVAPGVKPRTATPDPFGLPSLGRPAVVRWTAVVVVVIAPAESPLSDPS